MLALRSVSASARRYKPTALLALATTPRTLPSSTALPRYQFSSIRSRNMAQVPFGQPVQPVPDNRAIVPLENPDPSIDLTDIQGDIYPTFPKKAEQFIFFSITNPDQFRTKLGEFRNSITTAAQVVKHLEEIEEARKRNKGIPKPLPEDRLVKLSQYQIAFSKSGLTALNVGLPGDPDFKLGPQREQAADLGDEADPTSTSSTFVGKHWSKDWREKTIDGVILAASESDDTCEKAARKALEIFGSSIKVEIIERGKVRPGKEEGHEHFGFLDGISQPAINGLVKPHAGQLQCDPGAIIMGLKGDEVPPFGPAPTPRPDWAINGSIMAFRKLHQRVPEFDKFLEENPIKKHGLTHEEGVALRGARMVGRWKSGVPIDLSPEEDDHDFLDPEVINNFSYHLPEPGQARCPFSAHIRKTAPREHVDKPNFRLSRVLPRALIMRAGIPYGPEVTDAERSAQKTSEDRGLLFVSYQSRLSGTAGFKFIQHSWANDQTFPPAENNSFDNGVLPGLDPIIGNVETPGPDRTRFATGTDATLMGEPLVMKEDFVVAEGGEYFFVPPMKTIDKISRGEPLPSLPGSAPGGGAPGAPSA